MKENTNMKYELSIGAAAKILGVGESRVSQLISAGDLDSTTIRGNKRISRESVERYAANRHGRGRRSVAKKPTTLSYTLMNADYEVMSILVDTTSDSPLIGGEVFDAARAPLTVLTSGGKCKRRQLNEWWSHRSVPTTRPGFEGKLASLGLTDPGLLPLKNLGLSLSDCYWLRPADQPEVTWPQVNYFDNDFQYAAYDDGDDWLCGVGIDSPDNTSEGELPKKWVIRDGVRMLIKGSRFDDQRPCNEVVATALHRRLLSAGDYVPYELVRVADGWACACPDFLNGREEFIPALYLKEYAERTRGVSNHDRFCRHLGTRGMDEDAVREAVGKMITCDFLLANNDRHWRNFGVVRNVDTLELRLAPLFDSGNCLWYGKTDAEVSRGDHQYVSRPFYTVPQQQLSSVEQLAWFDPAALEGFVDEAMGILGQSAYAGTGERRAFIRAGLESRVRTVSVALPILRYRSELEK